MTDKPEPKYRRQLNDEQLLVLKLLFRFRFMTALQIATYLGKPSALFVQKRLKILAEQGHIAKHYDGQYKLQGRPAEHYLLSKGARLLRDQPDWNKRITNQAIKNLYKDKTASQRFLAHSTNVAAMFLKLRAIYGDKLDFFTKTQMNLERYDYLPQPLPDAYIRLKRKAEKRFFLDIFEDDIPLFVIIARIKKYLAYSEEGDWEATDTDLPAILMITESKRRQKQVLRRIAKELRESYEDDVVFAATTKEALLASEDGKIWLQPDDTDRPKALHLIS